MANHGLIYPTHSFLSDMKKSRPHPAAESFLIGNWQSDRKKCYTCEIMTRAVQPTGADLDYDPAQARWQRTPDMARFFRADFYMGTASGVRCPVVLDYRYTMAFFGDGTRR
jgi:hypothetical protein